MSVLLRKSESMRESALTLANVKGIQWFPIRPVITVLTFVAIDSRREMATVLTDSSSFVFPLDIKRPSLLVHFLIVVTFSRVSKTVAGCFHEKRIQVYQFLFKIYLGKSQGKRRAKRRGEREGAREGIGGGRKALGRNNGEEWKGKGG